MIPVAGIGEVLDRRLNDPVINYRLNLLDPDFGGTDEWTFAIWIRKGAEHDPTNNRVIMSLVSDKYQSLSERTQTLLTSLGNWVEIQVPGVQQ